MESLFNKLNININQVELDKIGRSKSNVFKVNKTEGVSYLKVGKTSFQYLSRVLEFLSKSNLSVPKCISVGEHLNSNYILMSECKGTMAHELEPEFILPIIAKELREIHSITIPAPYFMRDSEYYLELLKKHSDKLSKSEREFALSLPNSEIQNDVVFTHGDYCLPNILYDGERVSLIDLDNAGYSFRYFDIIDCINSIRYNFKDEKYVSLFLNEYGIILNRQKEKEIYQLYDLLEKHGI